MIRSIMSNAEILDVVKARMAGKIIEYRSKACTKWRACCDNEPCWDFPKCEYRVKPESQELKVHCPDSLHNFWYVQLPDGTTITLSAATDYGYIYVYADGVARVYPITADHIYPIKVRKIL